MFRKAVISRMQVILGWWNGFLTLCLGIFVSICIWWNSQNKGQFDFSRGINYRQGWQGLTCILPSKWATDCSTYSRQENEIKFSKTPISFFTHFILTLVGWTQGGQVLFNKQSSPYIFSFLHTQGLRQTWIGSNSGKCFWFSWEVGPTDLWERHSEAPGSYWKGNGDVHTGSAKETQAVKWGWSFCSISLACKPPSSREGRQRGFRHGNQDGI